MKQIWVNTGLISCISFGVLYWEYVRREAIRLNKDLHTKKHSYAIFYWCWPDYPVLLLIGISAILNWFFISVEVHLSMKIFLSILYSILCVASGFFIGRGMGRILFGQAPSYKEYVKQNDSKA